MKFEPFHPVITMLRISGVSIKEIAASANVTSRHIREVEKGHRQSKRVEGVAKALLSKIRD